jgi:hypothetical protein
MHEEFQFVANSIFESLDDAIHSKFLSLVSTTTLFDAVFVFNLRFIGLKKQYPLKVSHYRRFFS